MKNQLWHFFIRRCLKYTSFFIAPFERRGIARYSQKKPEFRPVFIIGPPRSGSTILYQLITEYLNVLFIDNLNNMAREIPWFGFWLSHTVFGEKSHHSFRSYHGNTKGLHAPNEGLFWYNWLPKSRHLVEPEEINYKSKQQMRDLIYALINKYQKPLIFKNLSFAVRLPLIHQLFPNAKIIYIKRDPLFVAQSIFMAKKKSNLPDTKLWSIQPREAQALGQYSPEKQAVHQTYHLYQQIEEDLSAFPSDQTFTLRYETINQTQVVIDDLKPFLKCTSRINKPVQPVSPNNKQQCNNQVFETLKHETYQLVWTFLNLK
jgi:hypothetical protein